ncbi:MAG: hypothetical protein HYU36_20075 [Planctomycetes bacterium]|nr:hypothetical protein [Planctomycetota bacterium]
MADSRRSEGPGPTEGQICVECPYEDCQRKFWLDEALAGKKVRCDKCHRRFVVSSSPGIPCTRLDSALTRPHEKKKKKSRPPSASALEPLSPLEAARPDAAPPPPEIEDEPAEAGTEPAEAADETDQWSLDFGKEKQIPAKAVEGFLSNVGGDEAPQVIPTTISLLDDDSPDSAPPAKPPKSSPGPEEEPPTEETRTVTRTSAQQRPAGEPRTVLRGPAHSTAPAPAPSAPPPEEASSSIGFKPVARAQSSCPQCGKAFEPTQTSCEFCGYRVGQKPVSAAERFRQRYVPMLKLAGGVAAVVLLALLALSFRHKLRSLLPSTASPGPAAPSEPNGSPSRRATTIVRSLPEELEVKNGEETVVVVRRGQPMLRKSVKNEMALVEVRTPEASYEGWVPEEQVQEDTETVAEDLLGYQKLSPEKHTAPVTHLAFRQDSRYLASLAEGGREINLWLTASGELARTYKGHQGSVLSAFFLKDDTLASVASDSSGLRIWDPLTTATLRRLPEIRQALFVMADGVRGIEIASGIPRVWNLELGASESASTGPVKATRIAASGNGKILVALLSTGEFQSYAMPGWKAEAPFATPKPARDFDLSPNAKWVAVAPQAGNEVLILSRETGKLSQRIGVAGAPVSIRFCRGDRYLAVSLENHDSVYLYETARPARPVSTHRETSGWAVTALECSPDGTLLATGHDQGSVRLWPLDIAQAVVAGGEEEARQDPEKDAKKVYSLFRSFLLNKKRAEAEKYYQELVEKYPNSPYTKSAREDLQRHQGPPPPPGPGKAKGRPLPGPE